MNYSDRITRAFFGLSAREFSLYGYMAFDTVCGDDGTDDLGISGDELAQIRASLGLGGRR